GYFKPMTPNSAINNCKKLGWPLVVANPSNPANCDTTNCAITDLTKIPSVTMYGTTTTGNNYTHSFLDDGTNTWNPVNYTANFSDVSGDTNSAQSVAAAAWNATDNIANTIRSDTSMNQIQIITIGYTGNGGVDTGLLNSVANTTASYRY